MITCDVCLTLAKEKLASSMKSGGGPRCVLTPAEEAGIQHLVKNKSAVLTGIEEGLDSSSCKFLTGFFWG